MIKSDFRAYNMTFFSLLKGLFCGHSYFAVLLYRCGSFLAKRKIKFFPDVVKFIALRNFSCEISPYAEIDEAFRIFHTPGIVIGWNVKIGKRCVVYQNVTIGEISGKSVQGRTMPVIGDDVTIYTGAVISGPIHIGNNVVIGANSVVLSDVPDNCFVAGAPAKIITYSGETLCE